MTKYDSNNDRRDTDEGSRNKSTRSSRKRSRSSTRTHERYRHRHNHRNNERSHSRRHSINNKRSRSQLRSGSPPPAAATASTKVAPMRALASPPKKVRAKNPALVQLAANLPAAQHRNELLEALATHRVVICVGETGSGKTTQIPQFLYEAIHATDGSAPAWSRSNSSKCIAVTQPRRVATISVAHRVADEMATQVGGSGAVGYAIRFDDRSSASTRIKFVTDGLLIRECLADPLLRHYSVVMLDEAHERSLHTDVLLGLLRQLVERRPHDFRVLVTSATLDHDQFAAFFSLPPPVPTPAANELKAETSADTNDIGTTTDINIIGTKSGTNNIDLKSDSNIIHTKPDTNLLGVQSSTNLIGIKSDTSAKPGTKKRAKVNRKAKSLCAPCPVVTIPGRAFPVEIFHSKHLTLTMGRYGPLSTTYVRSAIETTLQIHNSEPPGHILVFLTGQREVDDACRQLRALDRQQQLEEIERSSSITKPRTLLVLPLYAALSPTQQHAVFAPVDAPTTRKVIVATNIAETSLTIDGVRFVVDCGFTKQRVYNPSTACDTAALVVVPVSKGAAQQRAGRAGRTAAGKCFRLYALDSFASLADKQVPEIQRSNVASVVLQLKLLGVHDVLGFPFIDAPAVDAVLNALQQLRVLGALDADGCATRCGRRMAAFPLAPPLARAIVESMRMQCVEDVVRIVAMLSVERLFEVGKQRQRHCERRYRSSSAAAGAYSESTSSSDEEDVDTDAWWTALLRQLERDGLVSDYGDHLSYAAILQAYERTNHKTQWCVDRQLRLRALQTASAIATQLRGIVESLLVGMRQNDTAGRKNDDDNDQALWQQNNDLSHVDLVRKSICAGFFTQAAQRCLTPTMYRTLGRSVPHSSLGATDADTQTQLVAIHPQSMLLGTNAASPAFCVYHELVATSKPCMHHVLSVEQQWLDEYASSYDGNDSLEALYALSGRSVPPELLIQTTSGTTRNSSGASHTAATSSSSKPVVDSDAITAARMRFIARKKQQQQQRI